MAGTEKHDDSGLSLRTLLISSASSVAAAIFTHMIWSAGVVFSAAVTPIIVATVSELLKRPTRVVAKLKPERRDRARVARDVPAGVPAPPPELERPDPFGIWKAAEPTLWERLKGKPLKIGLATGALAFVIGAVALTGTELLFGGSVTGDDKRTTIFSGSGRGGDAGTTTTPSTTGTTETAPGEELDEDAPKRTTPDAPEATPTTPEQTPTTPEQTPTTPQPQPPGSGGTPAPEGQQPAQPNQQSLQPGQSAAPAQPSGG